MYAAGNGHEEIVKTLTEHGANVNYKNNIGDPLFLNFNFTRNQILFKLYKSNNRSKLMTDIPDITYILQ